MAGKERSGIAVATPGVVVSLVSRVGSTRWRSGKAAEPLPFGGWYAGSPVTTIGAAASRWGGAFRRSPVSSRPPAALSSAPPSRTATKIARKAAVR